MTRAIIVENNKDHAARLKAVLEQSGKPFTLLAVCATVPAAVACIDQHRPDMVFLDIDLDDGGNGFEVLDACSFLGFQTIVTTQYNTDNNYNLAFRCATVAFIMKPVILHHLQEVLEDCDIRRGALPNLTLRANLQSKEGQRSIIIRHKDDDVVIAEDQIRYCESDNTSTYFLLVKPVANSLIHTSGKPIKYWEESLRNSTIMRVHKQYLVNLLHVKNISRLPFSRGLITMDNGKEIDLARERKEEVIARWKRLR